MDRYKILLKELFCLVAGTTLMAAAVNWIYEPLDMVTGGISGLSIVVKYLSGRFIGITLPVWVSNFVLNIPIFIWGVFIKGKEFIAKTLFANTVFSLAMYIIPVFDPGRHDYLLAAVVGGVLTGVGLGLVFATGYSTGGTDLLSTIICKYIPYYSVSTVLFVIDSVVIITGAVLFGLYISFYAVIAIFVSSSVMDYILSGGKACKQVLVISPEYKEISMQVFTKMERGATLIEAKGMYSNNSRPVLLCVVARKEIAKLTGIVKNIDRNAFVIISEIREVFGEGFGQNKQ
ncbi:MAG: YitT family protein [Lachnospiraceae bacterium]